MTVIVCVQFVATSELENEEKRQGTLRDIY